MFVDTALLIKAIDLFTNTSSNSASLMGFCTTSLFSIRKELRKPSIQRDLCHQAGEMMVKCSRSNQAVAKVRNTVANQAFLPRTQRRGMRERRTEASIGNSSTTLSTLKKVWPPSKPSTRVKGRP